MTVHNIMEDVVFHEVDKLYEDLLNLKTPWLTCACDNCRMDTVSYVLNHIPPKYVVSGRGAAHSTELLNDGQVKADIESIALQGCRIVSATKRPYHNQVLSPVKAEANPVFNFPTFSGTIIDGSNFEPVIGASVLLKYEGKEIDMIDKTWLNPYITCQSTKGVYTFWVKPFPAEAAGITKKFNFTIEVSAPDYDTTTLNLEITLTSDSYTKIKLDSTFGMNKDIFIFNTNITNEMDM